MLAVILVSHGIVFRTRQYGPGHVRRGSAQEVPVVDTLDHKGARAIFPIDSQCTVAITTNKLLAPTI